MINNRRRLAFHVFLLSILAGVLAGTAIREGSVPIFVLFPIGVIYGMMSVVVAVVIDRWLG